MIKIVLAIIFFAAANPFSAAQTVQFSSSNLPIIIIKTNGNVIKDEPKVNVDMGIIFNGEGVRNNLTDSANDFRGKVGIEIRGSSSQFFFPKKQYGFEVIDSLGEDKDVSLLGLPEESDWILSAPYTDKTLMRDELLYSLASSLGYYSSRSRYCELVIDNQYLGVYVLLEKIKRDKKRINITKLPEADSAGTDITGGYIIKIDKNEGADNAGWRSSVPPYPGAWQRVYYQYDTPDPQKITQLQKQYIESFMNEFENIMLTPDYADTVNGYFKYINEVSFVDFILLNELSKNVDSYRLSTFLYKDKDSKNGKLHAGPVWDYNLAFGNCDYYSAGTTTGFHIDYLSSEGIRSDEFLMPSWWKKLFNNTGFRNKLSVRWNKLRENEFSLGRINSFIDSVAQYLSEAKERNFKKWPVLGVKIWPNLYIGKTYNDEINYMKQWISSRFQWLDKQLEITTPVENGGSPVYEFTLQQNYPNPFNPVTTINYSIPTNAFTQLKIFDLLGREAAVLVNEEQTQGPHEVKFNGAELSSGIYFYQLKSAGFSDIKKFVLLK